MIFDAYVLQTVLYGVEVWGGNISPSTWNDIEKLQKAFIRRHLGIKSTTPYALMLLETGRRPIEMYAMIRVVRYINRVRQMDEIIGSRNEHGQPAHAYKKRGKAKCCQQDGCLTYEDGSGDGG